jgi:Tol biopolymer transport system component
MRTIIGEFKAAKRWLAGWWLAGAATAMAYGAAGAGEAQLGKEIGGKGWLLFAAKSAEGDYDLFLSRPDGTQARNVTKSPQFNEFGGRFSPDGRKLLYRRSARGEPINHDLWGALGVPVVASADGSEPKVLGEDGDLPWACWSPDGKQVSCLYKKQGLIRVIDIATRQVVRELPRQGIFQQLFWSADGKRVCGTANLNGQDWNIISVELAGGNPTLLSRNLNCTPDWFQHDPNRVIYSNRTPGLANDYGWTMLMQATADGRERTLIYGERGRHVYYGCTSPDDQYVVFSLPESDGGVDAHMAIVRLADTPIIVPEDYRELKELYPTAKGGPVFRLTQAGFEPHWTYAEVVK